MSSPNSDFDLDSKPKIKDVSLIFHLISFDLVSLHLSSSSKDAIIDGAQLLVMATQMLNLFRNS